MFVVGVVLIPILTFFLVTALRFGAASAEFGMIGGHMALRQGALIPSLVISFLLLGGMISFFIADFKR